MGAGIRLYWEQKGWIVVVAVYAQSYLLSQCGINPRYSSDLFQLKSWCRSEVTIMVKCILFTSHLGCWVETCNIIGIHVQKQFSLLETKDIIHNASSDHEKGSVDSGWKKGYSNTFDHPYNRKGGNYLGGEKNQLWNHTSVTDNNQPQSEVLTAWPSHSKIGDKLCGKPSCGNNPSPICNSLECICTFQEQHENQP